MCSITNGLADRELCIGTEGLNQHAQAEPSWLPVWTVDGDEAGWIAKGTNDDGKWELNCEPHHYRRLGASLEIFLHGITCQLLTVTPEQARALRHTLGEWLNEVAS